LLSFVGLVMVGVGGFSCELLQVSSYGYDSYYGSYGYGSYIGFTSAKVGGTCVRYATVSEPALQAGNAFAILATLVGVLTLIGAILTTFLKLPRVALVVMTVMAYVVAAFAFVVTGVGFATAGCNQGSVSCLPGPKMYVVLVGAFFWIGAGTALVFVKRHERADLGERSSSASDVPVASLTAEPVKDFEPTESSSTVVETFINPDGTKTRTTTVTSFKDGAKVVEKTNEAL
jgi:hypothetical protein